MIISGIFRGVEKRCWHFWRVRKKGCAQTSLWDRPSAHCYPCCIRGIR